MHNKNIKILLGNYYLNIDIIIILLAALAADML